MPEVIVRKRIAKAKRPRSWRERLQTWISEHRPQLAVAVAFAMVVVIALSIAAFAINDVSQTYGDSAVRAPS